MLLEYSSGECLCKSHHFFHELFPIRYICSNDTKLPGAFDACQNKEQLWTAVRKGLRPERLPRFDSDCWELMTSCWHGDSLQRPLIGDIAMRLILIMKRIGRKPLKN